MHRRPHLRVAPVEVRLLLEEGVVVVLPRCRVPRPRRCRRRRSASCWAGRHRGRDRARCTSRAWGLLREARGFLEPGMLVGACGWARSRECSLRPRPCASASRRSKSASVPKSGIDVAVVGDVVAEIGHRRGIDRRDPDRIDAEPDEIIEPRQDAGQIADAVAVRVLKGARIDLIDDAALPPDRRAHGVLTELHNSGRSSL